MSKGKATSFQRISDAIMRSWTGIRRRAAVSSKNRALSVSSSTTIVVLYNAHSSPHQGSRKPRSPSRSQTDGLVSKKTGDENEKGTSIVSLPLPYSDRR